MGRRCHSKGVIERHRIAAKLLSSGIGSLIAAPSRMGLTRHRPDRRHGWVRGLVLVLLPFVLASGLCLFDRDGDDFGDSFDVCLAVVAIVAPIVFLFVPTGWTWQVRSAHRRLALIPQYSDDPPPKSLVSA